MGGGEAVATEAWWEEGGGSEKLMVEVTGTLAVESQTKEQSLGSGEPVATTAGRRKRGAGGAESEDDSSEGNDMDTGMPEASAEGGHTGEEEMVEAVESGCGLRGAG
ncbi:hypothetical protein AAFF_G00373900 [Aldrovandia affinis]|uniref:Uncharacterized protein n=1 Tax=Aldrovandia affinis TaxID=143900 RepID=A0AAD7R6S4_9TELE|nr:hypothetical protein AAFF_G00373900 [Aldrovandia affinis]